MQATADGEFYPEKDLDKNYRIPKRRANEIPKTYSPAARNNTHYNATQTPLASSYYNYPYDPNAASAYYGNYAQYYSQYSNAGFNYNNANYSANKNSNTSYNSSSYNANSSYNSKSGASPFGLSGPPPPPPGTSGMEPIKQNIYKTLKDIKEQPKNFTPNIFQNTVPDIMDESLPKDLKALFQPLFCKLCSAHLSSNQNAKMHYKSKNHEKKIKTWLIEYSEKTGEPLHKRAKVSSEKQAEDVEKNPAWYHCDICDLPLTGRLHAESHYMGRNHQKVLAGHKTPTGQGYYDDNGKWIRVKAQKTRHFNFQNGEDNFGTTLRPNETDAPPLEVVSPIKKNCPAMTSKFHCDICDINTTCQEQLDNHFRGQKHLKKLKLCELNKYNEAREGIDQAAVVPPPTPILLDTAAVVPIFNEKDLNLSVYRTPSGDFYCPTCNITTNSEGQFLQHLKSKNHAKKAAQKKSGST